MDIFLISEKIYKVHRPINQSTNQLINYTLHLADNSLIMGHRLSEWTGHGPILEQDIAISNIALDLIGQARNFYQYSALIMNSKVSQEDAIQSNSPTERSRSIGVGARRAEE